VSSDPKNQTIRQGSQTSAPESTAEEKQPPFPSNTPPPLSYPNDVDTAWDSEKKPSVRSEPEPSATSIGPALMPKAAPAGPVFSESPNSMTRHGRFAPGSKFGVYELGECIGEGGMARVYQAEHAGLRRQVALKVLLDGFGRDPDGRERFVREARIAAAIKHPNVVNIFDVGVCEDIPYLVMEFLDGQDLEKLLQSKGSLEESLIIDIMVPVVAGLLAVHDAGIVHRDLKPGNIFLARGRYNDLEPKLLDFGISKAQGTEQLQLTANHAFMGTPFYISPEALHGGEMTPLSDQYSLGIVMYECATGVTPFRASSLLELSNVIGSGQYTRPTEHKPELSLRLARIIERAMSLDPEDRFKDMREMGCELLTLAGQRTRITWGLSFGDTRFGDLGDIKETVPSRRDPRERSTRPPTAARRKKRVVPLILGIAALFLFVVGFFAWPVTRRLVSTRRDEAPGPPPGVTAGRATNESAPGPSAASGGPAPGEQHIAAAPTPSAGPVAVVLAPAKGGGDAVGRTVAQGHQGIVRRATTNPTSGARRQSAGTEADPEWALPPAVSVPPNPTKPEDIQFGANNAPILD
jgi:serine/threonine protein kinase